MLFVVEFCDNFLCEFTMEAEGLGIGPALEDETTPGCGDCEGMLGDLN